MDTGRLTCVHIFAPFLIIFNIFFKNLLKFMLICDIVRALIH